MLQGMVASSSRGQRSVITKNGWLLAGYGGLAGYFIFEALARKPGDASSLKASGEDRGTTRLIVCAFVAATLLPLASLRIRALTLPRAAGPAGLVLQAGGITLRVWSMRTLGDSYTRTLRTRERQPLVEAGPYRVVRHPGYAGSLLSWTGFALTSRSLRVVAAVTALLGRVYRQRIVAEEALLCRELPGYSAYGRRTRRLIPFVW
jgi:protein-S-isoprenylcysteine O-methyltransferase Ste14